MKRAVWVLATLLCLVSCGGPLDLKIDVFCTAHGDQHSGILDCLWGSDGGLSTGGSSGTGGSAGSGGVAVEAGAGGASSGGAFTEASADSGDAQVDASAGGTVGSGGVSGSGGSVADPCANGILDGAETDVDCGGGVCPGCADGKVCSVLTDCAHIYCTPGLICATPTCTDGVQNGTETGLDCGGSCPACPTQLQLVQQNIRHMLFIVMENRTFDHYFGTYPGADGLPQDASGNFTSCNPDPNNNNVCARPFHLLADNNSGGPHSQSSTIASIHGGLMDRFVQQAELSLHGCADPQDPNCSNGTFVDAMGFHNRGELSKYWAYADNFVLQDHLYESDQGYSLSSHLAMVSAWSALCTSATDPSTCTSRLDQAASETRWAWTDITQLMFEHNVSWRYYLGQHQTPSCSAADAECPPCGGTIAPGNCNGTNSMIVTDVVPPIWNPLPTFATVQANGQTANIADLQNYYAATPHTGGGCALPDVAWIAPGPTVSEHPSNKVTNGQKFVVGLLNRLMHSDCWATTAAYIFWDDYGGFFDHKVPPVIDSVGYGIRVPGLMISPWAKPGFIDHQQLSFDAHLKLIEDVFLGGARLDPATMARPDPRPSVRERAAGLGDLITEFDFSPPPRPALVLTQSVPLCTDAVKNGDETGVDCGGSCPACP